MTGVQSVRAFFKPACILDMFFRKFDKTVGKTELVLAFSTFYVLYMLQLTVSCLMHKLEFRKNEEEISICSGRIVIDLSKALPSQ